MLEIRIGISYGSQMPFRKIKIDVAKETGEQIIIILRLSKYPCKNFIFISTYVYFLSQGSVSSPDEARTPRLHIG